MEDRWAQQQAEKAEYEAAQRAQQEALTKKQRIALQARAGRVGPRVCLPVALSAAPVGCTYRLVCLQFAACNVPSCSSTLPVMRCPHVCARTAAHRPCPAWDDAKVTRENLSSVLLGISAASAATCPGPPGLGPCPRSPC